MAAQPIATGDDRVTPIATSSGNNNQRRVSYTVAQAAELCGLPVWTLYKAIHAGQLPAIKRGRYWVITPDALDRWVAPS